MNSWAKIAVGARLVVSAVVKETAEETAVAAQRLTRHCIDVSSRVRKTATETQNYDNITTFFSRTTDQRSNQSVPRSDGTNPYESQLRKKNLSAHSSKTVRSALCDEPTLQASAPNPFLLHAEKPEPVFILAREEEACNDDSDVQSSSASSPLEQAMGSTANAIRTPTIQEAENSSSPMKEGRAVPASRVGRAAGFVSLGVGLALGTVSEMTGRLLGSGNRGNPITSDANADRLAATLCRMRGAALKMGQMLSIQDESLLPPALSRALTQVRQGADAMPNHQLVQQMESQLGKDWRNKFESFDDLPFAAASIGQVHRATVRNGDGSLRQVVVKVQYPGVANSIESDLRNLTMLVTLTGLAPKGLFLENVVRVGRDELKVECNYLNELANQQAFQALVAADPILIENKFMVPDAIEELTTEQVIVSDYSPGGTIDKVIQMDQNERDRVGRAIMYLTMQELFVWRLMQTDPNWGNFLYDVGSKRTTLIDFGATREYPKDFVDGYLRIVWANANEDEPTLMEISRKMGFLTGEENDLMLEAHKRSGFTLGEPFAADEPFDFKGSRISSRMSEHTSVFLKHRLTPPPEEVYTLHRKLAGAFMLCIKLGSHVRCRDLLEDIMRNHIFDDGLPHPLDAK